MKDYKVNGKVVEMTLENGKIVKCSTEWVEKSMKALETDMEDVLLMWLEDNDYIVNEEQEELDKEAKGKVKLVAKTEKPKVKTQKERVVKSNPDKEYIVGVVAEFLEEIVGKDNINIENKAKLIRFTYKGSEYKLDLVQKRPPKVEK